MKTIITIQHTQSVHHTNGMVGSWTDWELTELGIAQAKRIGEALKAELAGQKPVLYSSDLKRARQTADCIGNALGVVPILQPELRERNLGCCCGKSVQWLREHQQCRERTIDDRLFPDAETRREEWNRLKPFFEELMSNPEEIILLVSHGDLLSVFNTMFMGLEAESLNTFEAFGLSGGVSRLVINGDGKRIIKKLSDMSYQQEKNNVQC